MLDKHNIATQYQQIQNTICEKLEFLDSKAVFETENWQRKGGGGGCSRVIQNGDLIEKGGVNFSAVHGILPDAIKKLFKTKNNNFLANYFIFWYLQCAYMEIVMDIKDFVSTTLIEIIEG
ncbi:MAG: coproporphyrinogen III oxidase [Sphingobacteriales bacterium]|nr:MAG: coproporphyrinogen III oxidase [Sphingobacteriales bacterium]